MQISFNPLETRILAHVYPACTPRDSLLIESTGNCVFGLWLLNHRVNFIENKFMKKTALIISLLVISTYGFSQSAYKVPLVSTADNTPSNWTSYVSDSLFDVEYKFIQCEHEIGYDQEYLIFRITNKTDYKLTLMWDMILHYNGKCKTCGYDYKEEYRYVSGVHANETVEGECELGSEYTLKIFSKFINTDKPIEDHLTAFQLGELKIEKCNK